MQHERAESAGVAGDGDAANNNDAVNARLVEILKANTVRASGAADAALLPKRGIFSQIFAMIGLVGLMAVAYVYGLVVGKDA
ncbi:hypothetical protein [Rhizobium sp. G21]|uniref:hypothetical protein n=1 Tax=Rhizobium sp. G21 TaxID=2758439 RepID=UPI0016022707|nr:hypothetical protein [Rhizobium sp. G21]MBB1247737.1 hypothetical protein [Rhizobium sp. G21]